MLWFMLKSYNVGINMCSSNWNELSPTIRLRPSFDRLKTTTTIHLVLQLSFVQELFSAHQPEHLFQLRHRLSDLPLVCHWLDEVRCLHEFLTINPLESRLRCFWPLELPLSSAELPSWCYPSKHCDCLERLAVLVPKVSLLSFQYSSSWVGVEAKKRFKFSLFQFILH